MPQSQKTDAFCQILSADVRFSLPDVMNDQVWELNPGISQPRALSLITTYGFRASQMHVFPEFTLEDQVITDPVEYSKFPEITYSSTNFTVVKFSPFQDIDVFYRLWVPTSQIIVGELACVNNSPHTKTLGVDWLVHLIPVNNGSPMRQVPMGLSTVLQGECADLFPVFYLAGGAYASSAAIPGLATKLLLMPGADKRLTWALASHTSMDASFQQARQFSSKSLDVEQLKFEMADKRDLLMCETAHQDITQMLERSNLRARQFVMPALQQFNQPTYVTTRDANTGSYPRLDILEINPGWSGQTLPEILLLAENLLPGNFGVIKGLLQNMFTHQSPDGSIDHQVGPNGPRTGHSALPILSQLVANLYPYLEDLNWLEEIHPRLLAFLKTWITINASDLLEIRELSHPIQVGIELNNPQSGLLPSDLWIRLKSSDNILVPSLLLREVSALLQITHLLQKETEVDWLEQVRELLRALLEHLWDNNNATFIQPDRSTGQASKGLIIHQYRKNGAFKPVRRLPRSGRIYVRICGENRVSTRFCCRIQGTNENERIEMLIQQSNLLAAGQAWVCVSEKAFSSVDSVTIIDLPVGSTLEIGQADLMEKDLTGFLVLYAGFLSPSRVARFLRANPIKQFFSEHSGALISLDRKGAMLPAPAYIVTLIVKGLLRYKRISLAEELYHCQFIDRLRVKQPATRGAPPVTLRTIDDLAPVNLFLNIRGLVRITGKEVILSHFIKRQLDAVTVQYNKVELKMKPFVTELRTQTGEVIYLNRAGPNRLMLE